MFRFSEARMRRITSSSSSSSSTRHLLLLVLLYGMVGYICIHINSGVVQAFLTVGTLPQQSRLIFIQRDDEHGAACRQRSSWMTATTTSTTTTAVWAKVATAKVYTSTAVALVPLMPEPLGGIEIHPIVDDSSSSSSNTGTSQRLGISRMKQMNTIVESRNQPSTPYQFWMTTYSDGKNIQDIRQTILKDASKKANFPGFRKGQVPPYAQPQITQFAIQESIIKTVEAMVVQYGLVSLSGSDGQVQVHEDVSEMTKLYKTGTSIQFTATLNAMYDPNKRVQFPSAQIEEAEMVSNDTTAKTTLQEIDATSSTARDVVDAVVVDIDETDVTANDEVVDTIVVETVDDLDTATDNTVTDNSVTEAMTDAVTDVVTEPIIDTTSL
jgi:Bacterial trigger factor protein (TF)